MGVISTNAVSKYFGTTKALSDISIHVNEGEIYGFLGLNGAGKTTLIKMLLGMIRPSAGGIRLFGKDLTRNFDEWNNVGYLVETPYAYPNLSVAENLNLYFQLRQLKDKSLIEQIISQLKLESFRHTKAALLSLGNKQRLGLAKALMHRPRLLILDEPINGLDPEGIAEVRDLLKDLAKNGTTVFLSSHILSEMSKLSDRIGIIHQGALIDELTNQQLQKRLLKKLVVSTTNNLKAIRSLMKAKYTPFINHHNDIEIIDKDAIAHPENVATLLVQEGIPPRQLSIFTEDLEMFFLRTIRPSNK